MREIFTKLGFDEQSIGQLLARIKARYEKSAAMPDYKDDVKAYKKQIVDLQKAVNNLDAAISKLSPPNIRAAQDALSHFNAGIQAMPREIPVNVGTGPDNKQPSQKTITKNRFVFDVAQAYSRQTGKKPTISVDVVRNNKKGGLFAEFLLACADELGISASGLVSRAQELIQKRAI